MSETETTESAEPQALPGDGLREGIVDGLRRRIGDALLDTLLKPNDDLWVRVATDAWKATGEALLDEGFDYFCFLSALDWMPSPYGRGEDDPTQPPPERATEVVQGYTGGETRMQVFARVTDTRRHVGVTIKVDVPDDTMTVESWYTVYAGANWHERETHEMFGIVFAGHPDLRNMYLPTDFQGFPLRKDFPLLARMVKPWPGIVDVEPMPTEDQPPQDDVTGELDPENLTPDQADGGVGSPPAEDLAAEEALEHSVEEAPDFEPPPPGDEGRTDSGAQQELVGPQTSKSIPGEDVTAAPTVSSPEAPEAIEEAHRDAETAETAAADADTEGGADPATATEAAYGDDEPGDRDGGAPVRDAVEVDEAAVEEAEGDAVTRDEAIPSGRPADDAADDAATQDEPS